MTDAALLLSGIGEPGRTLALCDETDLTIAATSRMVADIHAWVALIMPSERYPSLRDSLRAYQAEYGVPEFHGNEIVNPGSKSAWKQIAYERRLDAYRFACALVTSHATELRHVHISAAQYAEWSAVYSDDLPTSHKDAVRRSFAGHIIDYLAGYAPAMLIFDKEKNNSRPTLEPVAGANHLAGGGILRAASHDVPGLQVADIAAYAIGRYLKRRDRIIAGNASAFDEVSMKMVADLPGRVRTLLGETH
jgi:hypothetical protein